jgi:hypothetical protein
MQLGYALPEVTLEENPTSLARRRRESSLSGSARPRTRVRSRRGVKLIHAKIGASMTQLC